MKKLWQKNVGPMDRCLRICIGITLIIVGAFYVKGTMGTVLFILSVPLILSAIFGVCPGYSILGVSTKDLICCSEYCGLFKKQP